MSCCNVDPPHLAGPPHVGELPARDGRRGRAPRAAVALHAARAAVVLTGPRQRPSCTAAGTVPRSPPPLARPVCGTGGPRGCGLTARSAPHCACSKTTRKQRTRRTVRQRGQADPRRLGCCPQGWDVGLCRQRCAWSLLSEYACAAFQDRLVQSTEGARHRPGRRSGSAAGLAAQLAKQADQVISYSRQAHDARSWCLTVTGISTMSETAVDLNWWTWGSAGLQDCQPRVGALRAPAGLRSRRTGGHVRPARRVPRVGWRQVLRQRADQQVTQEMAGAEVSRGGPDAPAGDELQGGGR